MKVSLIACDESTFLHGVGTDEDVRDRALWNPSEAFTLHMFIPCLVRYKNGLLISREITHYPQAGKNHILLRDISKKRRCQFHICYRRYNKAFGTLRVDGIGGLRREQSSAVP